LARHVDGDAGCTAKTLLQARHCPIGLIVKETAMTVDRKPSKAKAHAAGGGNGMDGHLPMFDMANLSNPMTGLVRMQAMGMRMVLTQQQEMLKFLRRRCEQDLRFIDTIVGAQETQGMVEAVADFYQTAARDYSAEIGRSAATGSSAAAAASEAAVELAKSIAEPPVAHVA
jgi:hypothetical protein